MSQTDMKDFSLPFDIHAEGQELLRQIVDFYHQTLQQAQAALAFLDEQGIDSETITRFRLGYADRTLGVFLPMTKIKTGALIRKRLKGLGLIRSTGHEHFNGSVMLPVFDEKGNVVQIFGRKVRNDLRKGTEMYPRLCDNHTVSFPEHELLSSVFIKTSETVAAAPVPKPPEPTAPAKPSADVPIVESNEDYQIKLGERSYRIRGLHRNNTLEVLKVNLRLWYRELYHLDTLDLYQARHRKSFVETAATETYLEPDLIKKDLGKVLLKLEEVQEKRIRAMLEPEDKEVELSEEERAEALSLLKSPDLLERITSDFEECGFVGESTNRLVGYLAATSRLLEKPLAILVQSASAAGKTTLMEAVLSMMPKERTLKYSAMTNQSLYYLGQGNVKHKILAIAEEEGASRASYALKLLQSEGELMIASTGRESTSGRATTEEYKVQGPVMLFLTTTAIDIDEELKNRCIVLTVDEGREQTAAIHRLQREARTLEGRKRKMNRALLQQLHGNAQRLLKSYPILNPFAPKLTFRNDQTRTRRDHEKYLSLIDAVTLLHQYQRKTIEVDGVEHLEVSIDDVKIANRLAHELLGHSLDELPAQTRKLLNLVKSMVDEVCEEKQVELSDYRFTRRSVRAFTGWSDNQLKIHMKRLEEMEYLLVHGGGRGKFLQYELLYRGEGQEGERFCLGLLEPSQLE